MDSLKTGQRYLDGWVLTYNLFRGHESLSNKTPGHKAKVKPPFKEWADVVKDGAASLPVKTAGTRPASRSPRKSPPRQAVRVEPPKAKGKVGDAAEFKPLPPGILRALPRAMRPKAGARTWKPRKSAVRRRIA